MPGKLLVTGGAGYVGSHCCRAFAEAGWDVTVFDNLSTGWRDLVKWGPLFVGDLQNPDEGLMMGVFGERCAEKFEFTREQQQPADQFQNLHDGEEAGHVDGTHEVGRVRSLRWHGNGHEMQPEVEAEDDKDQAEQVAGDGGGEFHRVISGWVCFL